MRKSLSFAAVSVLILAGFSLLLTAPALAQPRPMDQDVFTPLTKGYALMREGKYDAAEYEFKAALKRDRYNPFALNNLAVLQEKEGKLKDALAYLTDAQEHAAEYYNKVEQTCFIGGLCAAIRPKKDVGQTSTVAPVIAENIKKLKAKMAATPSKPEPSTPPKMK